MSIIAVYRDVPKPPVDYTEFDFSSLPIDPRITFTRSTTGTYFDSDGVMQTAAINEPRIDHDPVTGEARGLLVEEQRTNLLTWSEDGDWLTKSEIAVEVNAGGAPNGAFTADNLVATATNSSHEIRRTFFFEQGVTYCISVFFKSNGLGGVVINLTGINYVAFNLITGSVTNQSAGGGFVNTEGSIYPVGEGFYRCVLKTTLANPSLSTTLRVYLSDDAENTSGVPGFTGDGTSGVYIWGSQIEQGSFPTSYIPTEGTAMTRAADVAVVNDLSSIRFNQDEGATLIDFDLLDGQATTTSRTFSGAFLRSSNSFLLGFYNNLTLNHNVARAFTGPTLLKTDSQTKATYTYKAGEGVWAAKDGMEQGTSSAGAATTMVEAAKLSVAHPNTGGAPYSQHIRRLRYYPRRLSNTELQELTA